jgi:hypothetical protein
LLNYQTAAKESSVVAFVKAGDGHPLTEQPADTWQMERPPPPLNKQA